MQGFHPDLPFMEQAITVVKAGSAITEGFYLGTQQHHTGYIPGIDKIFMAGLSVP
jgi:hypothetical protein